MTADQISSLRRISDIPRSAQFWDVPTKSWQPIRSAHMGHVGEDVVDYWNRREKFLVKNRLKSDYGLEIQMTIGLKKVREKVETILVEHKIEVDTI